MKQIKGFIWLTLVGVAMVMSTGCKENPIGNSECVPTAMSCTDGVDNDCDGFIDCNDIDCAGDATCNKTPAPVDKCKEVKCNPGWHCDDKSGDCVKDASTDSNSDADTDKPGPGPVDLCEGVKCDPGEECSKIDGNCYGESDKCKNVDCDDENASCDPQNGECACHNDFVKEGGICIHSKEVPCNANAIPEHAESISANVTINYTTEDGWEAAAACKWQCADGYKKKGDSCVLPSGSECKDIDGKSYHREGEDCVRDIYFVNGNAGAVVLEPEEGHPGEALAVRGTFTNTTAYPVDERKDGRCPGVKAQLCYEADGQAGSANSFASLTCVDAAYEKDDASLHDVYVANVTFNQKGKYMVMYKWSGDGGINWYYTDTVSVRPSWEKVRENIGAAAYANIVDKVSNIGILYENDFDSLGKTQGKLTNIDAMAGWFATAWKMEDDEKVWIDWGGSKSYNPSYGNSTNGGLYNYGSQNATDRALGTLASNSDNDMSLYLVLKNDSDAALSKITVSYTGEQWRRSANKDEAGVLHFSYAVLDSEPASYEDVYDVATTDVASLDFNAPQGKATGSQSDELDGNLEANRVSISASFNVAVPVDSYIMLKWLDPREIGANSSLGIDDLTVKGE